MKCVKEWENYTWVELQELITSGKYKVVTLLPIGSIEQHGPHLPLGMDYIIADRVSELVIDKVSTLRSDVCAIKLPPVPFGVSIMWSAYVGTISLSQKIFWGLITDILTNLLRSGVKKILIINAHAGNDDILRVSAREAVERVGDGLIAVTTIWHIIGDVINKVAETKFFHADEVETSIALALGIKVRLESLRGIGSIPKTIESRMYDEFWHSLDLTKRPRVHIYTSEAGRKYGVGAFGKPELASIEKGRVMLRLLIERLADLIIKLAESRH